MGVISTVREALRPAEIARAFRGPSAAQTESPGRIGRRGPPVGVVMAPPTSGTKLVSMEAMDAQVASVVSIWQLADRGDTARFADLCEDSRDRDSRLDAVCIKRVQAVTGRPIVFHPPEGLEDDREAKLIAERVSRLLLQESRQFRQQLVHLAHGAVLGWGVSEIEWRVTSRGYVPDLRFRHPNRFGFDPNCDYEPAFYNGPYRGGTTQLIPLSNYPDRFVVHTPFAGKSSYPWRRGAVRSCLMLSLLKRFGLRWWIQLVERFGKPQHYATGPASIDDEDSSSANTVQTTLAALRGLSENWVGYFTDGIEINSIPQSGNVRGDLHQGIVDFVNTEHAIRILGQNLTTEVTGGSYAATEAHRFVADDIAIADADELSETLTQQVVEPTVRYNWPGAPAPRAEIVTVRKQPFTNEDVTNGVASPDERRASIGWPAQPDGRGKDIREPVSVQVPSSFGPQLPDEPGGSTPDSPVPEEGAKDADAALNGAQVQSLVGIVEKVAAGDLPRESGIQLIVASFPLNRAQAEAILDDAGLGFTPADGGEAPGGAPDPDPFPSRGQTSPTTTSETSGHSTHPLARSLSRR